MNTSLTHSLTKTLAAILTAAFLLTLGVSVTEAATIGHWRFESGGFTDDSSTNSLDMTNTGVDAYPLPATGPGSDFPSVIPQTGASNGKGAEFAGGSDKFSVSDNSVLDAISTNKAFTAEAFVNMRDDGSYVIAQWGSSDSFGFVPTADWANFESVLLLSSDGSSLDGLYQSGIPLDLDKDYYIAVAVDLTQADQDDRIVFYAQNLTDGGALQVSNITGVTQTSIHNSTEDLTIGTRPGANAINGIVDEVRLSSTQLSQSELLITVIPEPASLALLGLGGLLIAGRRRRRV